MLTLGDLKARFLTERPPQGASDGCHSPYMLLGGALFSMGCANTDDKISLDTVMFDIDPGTWDDAFDQVKRFSADPRSAPWIRTWFASYMLTNALFRIAAAVEKICYLCGADSKTGRPGLWKTLRDKDSSLSRILPAAHEYLGGMPRTWGERAQHLKDMRVHHEKTGAVTQPLICVIIQADTDKHVPYRPLKVVDFEWQLAFGGYVQALDLWEQATGAHRAGRLRL